jgi:tripartite-type tricarboxylate transporter receptor subunit TctC
MKRLIAFFAAVTMALPAWAQIAVPKELQGKTVTVIVPYPAGGQSDVWNRVTATKVRDLTGLNVIILNRPGGDALIGAAEAAKSAPDGTTLFGSESSPLVLSNLLQEPNAVPRNQFATISVSYRTPQGFYVRTESKYQTLRDLMDDVRANPGKVNIGHISTVTRLVTKRTMSEINGQFQEIPYKGAAPAITDLLGGHVDVLASSPIILQQVRAGKVRALAFSGPNRLTEFPSVGLIRDQVPGFAVENFAGLWAPAGTPKHIIDFYNRVYREAYKDPAAQEFLKNTSAGLFDGTPEEAERFIQSNENFWRPIVAKYGK